jgi:hypothetical protein
LTYESYEADTAPPWLQGRWGRAWFRVSGTLKDTWIEAAKNAVKARFAAFAPVDALPLLLRDYALDELHELEATTRQRLARAWETWSLAGTKRGMVAVLTAAAYVGVSVWENWQWTEVRPERWWQFWVVVRAPFPWATDPLADGTWSSPGTWNDGGIWASAIPVEDWARLRAIIRRWKPAHATATMLIALHSGELFGTRRGTWGEQTSWGGTATHLAI